MKRTHSISTARPLLSMVASCACLVSPMTFSQQPSPIGDAAQGNPGVSLRPHAGKSVSVSASAPVPLAAPTLDVANLQRDVRASLEGWRTAWANKDVEGYLASYASTFAPPDGKSRAAWEKQRRARVGGATDIEVSFTDVTVVVTASDRATSTFTQRYSSAGYKDSVKKSIEWVRIAGEWKITRETSAKA